MARKATIQQGDTFKDKEGQTLTVTKYISAVKIVVNWEDGFCKTVSAQQLRSGKVSKIVRQRKGKPVETVEQPYKQTEEVQEDWVDESATMSVTGLSGSSLFDNVEPDESYKDSDED